MIIVKNISFHHGSTTKRGRTMKLERGTSFIEFYYIGLSIAMSRDLALYVKNNRWYFDRAKPEIQEQFRRLYQIYKKGESE